MESEDEDYLGGESAKALQVPVGPSSYLPINEGEDSTLSARERVSDHGNQRKDKVKAALARGSMVARKAARRGYEKSKRFIANQYTRLKQDARKGPRIISWASIIACLFLVPGIFLDIVTLALTLSPVEVLSGIYALLGTVLILAAEFARRSNRYGVRSMLHYYLRFVEFSAGLGTIQMFVASVCVGLRNLTNLLKFVPGIILLLCGIVNIVWGMYAACKLTAMMSRLRDSEGDINAKTMTEKLDLIERKFEALDKRGDRILTAEDLRESLGELNMMMNEDELLAVFRELDKDERGYLSKDKFEAWWLAHKGVNIF